MELNYKECGEYQIPEVRPNEEAEGFIGKYGGMRKKYLKEKRRGTYSAMLLEGTLKTHLMQVQEEALAMMERLTEQMAKSEGVTEELKAKDQMAWVRRMNNIRNRAEEIVNSELIYA